MGSSEVLASRLSLIRDVMEALNDDKVCMIGICGMAGIGKTTMATEVVKRARNECMFYDTVMVSVSQNPNVERIQHDIAEMLGLLLLEDQDLSVRASRLHERLTQKGSDDKPKRNLIVLDDVWMRLDLEEIGIPSRCDLNGCKILLTSRSRDVCAQMNVDKIFTVEVLPEEEAWAFFQNVVSFVDDDYYPVAKEIVKQCGGLPLVIITTARQLRGRGKHAWMYLLRQQHRSFFTEWNEIVYRSLMLSYNFLETQEIRDFFLLCSLFPGDSEIHIEDLVRYVVGLRLFRNIENLQEARDRAYAHVEALQNSDFLLRCDNKECVKMKELMQRFALSIVHEADHVMVETDQRSEWPIRDTYEDYSFISVNCEEMYELPSGLECPNLKLLQLTGSSKCSLSIPEIFFQGMEKIQVLALRSMPISSLPGSLQILTNLRTLFLSDCTLMDDVSLIGNLENLEILSFAYCDIKEIPSHMAKLSRLRLLDFTGCEKLHKIAPGVLSSLFSLEELYMKGTSIRWAEQMRAHHDGEANASFLELKSLSRLMVMEIYIPYEVLPIAGAKPGFFRKGKRYNMN